MKTVRHITLISAIFLTLVSFGQRDKLKIKSKKCFCDSIFNITQSDTLTEYLCYKESYIYKLQRKSGYEKISRVYPTHIQYDAEILITYSNDSSKKNGRYFSLIPNKSNYHLNYIGVEVDSIKVTIFNSADTLYSMSFKGNQVILSKSLIENSENVITVDASLYASQDFPGAQPTAGNCGGSPDKTVTYEFIPCQVLPTKTNYLVKFSLDKVLPNIKRCIVKR